MNGVVWPQDVRKKPRKTRMSKRFRFVLFDNFVTRVVVNFSDIPEMSGNISKSLAVIRSIIFIRIC